jgi:hypothetical protein
MLFTRFFTLISFGKNEKNLDYLPVIKLNLL